MVDIIILPNVWETDNLVCEHFDGENIERFILHTPCYSQSIVVDREELLAFAMRVLDKFADALDVSITELLEE